MRPCWTYQLLLVPTSFYENWDPWLNCVVHKVCTCPHNPFLYAARAWGLKSFLLPLKQKMWDNKDFQSQKLCFLFNCSNKARTKCNCLNKKNLFLSISPKASLQTCSLLQVCPLSLFLSPMSLSCCRYPAYVSLPACFSPDNSVKQCTLSCSQKRHLSVNLS